VILMELLNIAALTFFPWIAMGWTFMSIDWYSKRTADNACWSSAQHISPSSQPSGTCSQMILLKKVLTSVLNSNYPFTHLQHITYNILHFTINQWDRGNHELFLYCKDFISFSYWHSTYLPYVDLKWAIF